MKDFVGYQEVTKITENEERVVFWAERIADQKPVVLKALKQERPSTESIALLYHEYEMGKDLDCAELIHTYDLLDKQNQYAVVQEYFGGISLWEYLQSNPIKNLSHFFQLAIPMVHCLEKLHRYNIIHKDIKPSNFLIDPESLSIKLSDFNFSSKLLHEFQDVVPPNKLEGTLAYMAPEQTGRMNMNIDYRSDFYALGISFFEMLTGHVPFSYQDPLELLHAHLANPIPDPTNSRTNIPHILIKIIQKLASKNPKDRYQSSVGLQFDLERAQKEFEINTKIKDFDLGQKDIYDRLNLSQKLYGREKEAKSLLNAYEHVSEGAVEALMICGHSGIGKTMLINEVHRPMIKDKAYFISGKFDQLQRNTPYTAITQAFNQLIRTFLAEPEAKFEKIKQDIIEALGDVAQVMINLVPDLERIIGKQPPLEKLTPQETQNRMKYFFGRFMKAVANQDHPLVVFIDDLQWADSASILLLEYILTNEELSHVFLIGAYRDNEVDEHHPLSIFIGEMRTKDKQMKSLPLSPLSVEDFEELFCDSFNRRDSEVRPFAELIHKRTEGNPLFCKQLINRIYNEKLLFFDYDLHRLDWQLEPIKNLKISENVVELMLHKLDELPRETQTLLKYASCVGNRFSIENLMLITGLPGDAIAKALWPSLQHELVITLRLSYKRAEAIRNQELAAGLSKEIVYQFIHDRVQQAVHQSMPEKERENTHLMIARSLNKEQPKGEELFELVDHFNAAHNLLKDKERFEVAELNYQAALLAKEANAYQPMSNYLKNALASLGEEAWDNNYPLMFAINREYALNLFLLHKIEESENHTQKLLPRAKSDFDKASLYRMQALCYLSLGENEKGFEASKIALNLLGVMMVSKPSKFHLLLKILQLRRKMRNFDPAVFVNKFEKETDPRIEAIFDILTDLFMSAYWYSVELFTYAILIGLAFALQYGNGRGAAAFLSSYGLILLSVFNDIDSAIKLNAIAQKILLDYPDKYSSCFVLQSDAFLLHHLHSPFKAARPIYQLVYQDAIESGNYMLAISSKTGIASNLAAESKSITEINEALAICLKFSKELKNFAFIPVIELSSILNQNLFQGSHYKADRLKELESIIFQQAGNLKYISATRLSNYYFFTEAFEQALYYHEFWYPHEDTVRYSTGTYLIKTTNAFVLAKYWANSSGLKKWHYARRFHKIKRELKSISQKSPDNYLHPYLYLLGTEAKLKKRYSEALIYFEKGIENAKKQDSFLWAALGNELAGEMLVEHGQSRSAIDYIREAHYYYKRYGLGFKITSLEKRYPHCFLEKMDSTTGSTSAQLDFLSLIKAGQTISDEIILDKLFEKMLHIVVENAGSERALFLEQIKNDWFIVASLEVAHGQEQFQILETSLKKYQDLPQSMIQYAIRSGEPLISDNAAKDDRYSEDPYILSSKTKSVLCLPILHHDTVLGIIYFENNLTHGAFTQDRVAVLNTLASQIAISLKNARHLEQMENLYRSTEKFVPKSFLQLLHKEHVEEVRLGDSVEATITVLFSDIRDYTTIMEKQSPKEAFAFINEYLKIMGPIIRNHHGFINQYQGDAIMALFPRNAEDGMKAVIEMSSALVDYNKKQAELNRPILKVGYGLNTGVAMLGTIGEEARMDANVISDAVNLASRVEALNKFYGTKFLISDATFNAISDKARYDFRLVDKVRVKGKKQVLYLYEVYLDDTMAEKEKAFIEHYETAFKAYESGKFTKSKALFEACQAEKPRDAATALFIERCNELIERGPPLGWDGTYTLLHK